MNALRDLLGQFSDLSIPTLQAPDVFGELSLEEASKRTQQRQQSITAYNVLFRDYTIKYGQFRRIGILFVLFVLVLLFLSAHQLPVSSPIKIAAGVGLCFAFLIIIWFLREDIAPTPDTTVSIDYIGKHYTNLRHQTLLEVAEPRIHWINPSGALGNLQFKFTTKLWVTGYKFFFAATDPNQDCVYFASYGSIDAKTRYFHFLDAPDPRFECDLGNFDYRDIPDPKPEIRIHFWIFAPFPLSWAPAFQAPAVQHEGLVIEGPGGRGFLLGAPSISLRSADSHVGFTRSRLFFELGWWHFRADDKADRVLREFVDEFAWTPGMTTVKYPRGRSLVPVL